MLQIGVAVPFLVCCRTNVIIPTCYKLGWRMVPICGSLDQTWLSTVPTYYELGPMVPIHVNLDQTIFCSWLVCCRTNVVVSIWIRINGTSCFIRGLCAVQCHHTNLLWIGNKSTNLLWIGIDGRRYEFVSIWLNGTNLCQFGLDFVVRGWCAAQRCITCPSVPPPLSLHFGRTWGGRHLHKIYAEFGTKRSNFGTVRVVSPNDSTVRSDYRKTRVAVSPDDIGMTAATPNHEQRLSDPNWHKLVSLFPIHA